MFDDKCIVRKNKKANKKWGKHVNKNEKTKIKNIYCIYVSIKNRKKIEKQWKYETDLKNGQWKGNRKKRKRKLTKKEMTKIRKSGKRLRLQNIE